jgi:VanZ family protein
MKRAAVLFTIFIIVIIILADMGKLPRLLNMIYDFHYGDKLGHFVLFGLLNFFITRAALSAFSSRNPLRVVVTAYLILALFVAVEEYSQNYFPSRTAEWFDLIAGCAGMFVGGWIAFKRRAMG